MLKSLESKECLFVSLKVGDNYKWWWQNPYFGDPNGCLGGKYKQFGKKLPSYVEEEKKPNPSAQDLKIQWEIHFLTLLNIGRNAKKN